VRNRQRWKRRGRERGEHVLPGRSAKSSHFGGTLGLSGGIWRSVSTERDIVPENVRVVVVVVVAFVLVELVVVANHCCGSQNKEMGEQALC
jgi:hypothetical protein